MKIDSCLLPALRGHMGDWVYYISMLSHAEIGARANYAREIHQDSALSDLIQRSLEGQRARHIANYLTTDQRFFNSLILATYGGSPDWLEIGVLKSTTHKDLLRDAKEAAEDAIGFLILSGKEKIFAIDGQHRLAGIKKAVELQQADPGDKVPVIFVAHKTSNAGLVRTRRLFTTLNKTAVPVRKRDIIALDEDDVMAIVARRLVEADPRFRSPKIAVISSSSIPAGDKTCLTTISSLYDTLKHIFRFKIGQKTDKALRFNRPSDETLNAYADFASLYFSAVAETFPAVKQLFDAASPAEVTSQHRTASGGHLLFRPIGLEIVTRVSIEIARSKQCTLVDAVRSLKKLPVDLADAPYSGVIWKPGRNKINARAKNLALDLVRYFVGLPVDEVTLLAKYRAEAGNDVLLPARN